MAGERLLIVDDDLSMREFLSILLARDGYAVEAVGSAEEAMSQFDAWRPSLVLTDLNMPGLNGLELLAWLKAQAARQGRDVQVVVVTAYGTTESAVEAMRHGAADYVLKPFSNDELRIVVRKSLEVQQVSAQNARLRQALQERRNYQRFNFGRLVGSSRAMGEVYELVRRVKDSRINCLVEGESGTGKEMVARAIHESGSRAEFPFVAINCGAIPENLVESELFGHKKGSFTGALRDKTGLIAAAHRGTLFLDEVAALPLAAQVKLLRALQERRLTPVGAVDEIEVDVRVIAASNVSLEDMVRDGAFRDDLYYRLNVVQIVLPPLRERPGDIPELVDHFVAHFAEEYGKAISGVSPDALRALQSYSYPGNVRELRNLVERAVALTTQDRITEQDIAPRLREDAPRAMRLPAAADIEFPPGGINLDALLFDIEWRYLSAALDASEGSKTAAAKLLQMSFRSFRYRLAKHVDSEA